MNMIKRKREKRKNIFSYRANVFQLRFDLPLVSLDQSEFVRVSLLLDGGNHSPTCSAGADHVFVGD
jgi:hypothetical protein